MRITPCVPRLDAGPGLAAAGLVLCATAPAACSVPPTPGPLPVSRTEAVSIVAAQYDTTSNYCGFSSCPSISPRPLVLESVRLDEGRRHLDACPTDALTRDPAVRVWAVVMRFEADPGEGQVWLVAEASGEILCEAEFNGAYRARMHDD